MDFRDLYLFLHLAESARSNRQPKFKMSASTLSRQIQRMEEEVGCNAVLLRDNRRVSPTTAGEKFRLFAQQNWQQWLQFKQSFKY